MAIEELAPTNAGLLLDEVEIGRWEARKVGWFVLQPSLETMEKDVLEVGSCR
jgi:hypothetical protein